MNDSPPIVVENLCKTYRDGGRLASFRPGVEALKGISFQAERGEIFGLLGPNGAGKTTFLKILLGIVRKSSGNALLLGAAAGDRQGRRRVGYLPEHLRIAAHQTAQTALDFYGHLSGLSSRQIRSRQDEILQTVGLAEWKTVLVKKYSKGMLQRLGLAQALLHDPDVLVLDEPTDGLDPLGRTQVRAMLAALKQQHKTVFLNSHLLQEVELICDRVAILDRGNLRYVGPIDEITAAQTTEVEFDLIGSEQAIRNALADRPIDSCESSEDGRCRLHLSLEQQTDVDACIDQLRSAGVGIMGLSRRGRTLEDAFLQLLSEPAHSA